MTRSRDKETVVSRAVARRIEGTVRNFDSKAEGEAALVSAVETVWKGIDIKALYSEVLRDVEKTIADNDYIGALKIYSNKGLVGRVGALFKHKDLPDYLRRLLVSDRGEKLTKAMLKHAPQLKE